MLSAVPVNGLLFSQPSHIVDIDSETQYKPPSSSSSSSSPGLISIMQAQEYYSKGSIDDEQKGVNQVA
jgi:hypothetical protein